MRVRTNKMKFQNYKMIKYTHQHITPNSVFDHSGFRNGVELAKIFFINEDILNLLNPEKTRNKVFERKMPFDNIWIDNTIKIKNKEFFGLFITNFTAGNYITMWTYKKENEKDLIGYKFNLSSNLLLEKNKYDWTKEDQQIQEEIRIFVCNFIDFLNNEKEKELINHKIDKERNMKRIKKGKCIIPEHTTIRINGKLEKYMNNLKNNNAFSYTHKFWVRGHYRHYENKTKWIKPYIKGRGMLINKNYEVKL